MMKGKHSDLIDAFGCNGNLINLKNLIFLKFISNLISLLKDFFKLVYLEVDLKNTRNCMFLMLKLTVVLELIVIAMKTTHLSTRKN